MCLNGEKLRHSESVCHGLEIELQFKVKFVGIKDWFHVFFESGLKYEEF